jgi:hypothetical protein
MDISNTYYNELSNKYNAFYATNLIAQEALSVYSSMSGRIEVSTAIDFIANNRTINPEDFPDRKMEYAKDYLSFVLDDEVKEAVLTSYSLSLKYRNLVYKYLSVDDPYRQSRVRVLTNILYGKWRDRFK